MAPPNHKCAENCTACAIGIPKVPGWLVDVRDAALDILNAWTRGDSDGVERAIVNLGKVYGPRKESGP